MRAYPSLGPLARCLFIHISYKAFFLSIKDIIYLLQRIVSVVERVISLPAALIFMIGGNWPVEVLFTD